MANEPSTGLADKSVGLGGDWIASISNVAPTALLGGWDAPIYLGDDQQHKRDPGRSVLISITFCTLWVIFLFVCLQGLAPASAITANGSNVLPFLAGKLGPKAFSDLVALAVIASFATTIQSQIVDGSRIMFGMGRERLLPRALGRETIRSQPLDGVVALGNCDKTVPAYLMALASADLPALIVTGGFRPVASFLGQRHRRHRADRGRADGRPRQGRGRARGAGGAGVSRRCRGLGRGAAVAAAAGVGSGHQRARVHGGAGEPGAGRRGAQGRCRQPEAAAARGAGRGVPFLCRDEAADRRSRPRGDQGLGPGTGRLRASRCGDAGVGRHPHSGQAAARGRQRHAAHQRRADERNRLRHSGPARRAGERRRRPAVPAAGRRHCLLRRLRGHAIGCSRRAGGAGAGPAPVPDKRGWPLLHRMHVTQAPQGCDYDFLQARTADQLPFAEPVIGRS